MSARSAASPAFVQMITKLRQRFHIRRVIGVRVAEHVGVGVLREERQHGLVAAAAFGDVMALDEVVGAEEGDGVEVEVERRALYRELSAQVCEPPSKQSDRRRATESIGVLREERGLRDHVEPGEEGEP